MTANTQPVASEKALAHTDLLADKDTAAALYRHLPSVLGFTFVGSSGIALFFSGAANQLALMAWWVAFQLISVCRYVEMVDWRRKSSAGIEAKHAIGRYALGVLTSALAWCFFSLAFFGSASDGERLVIALVLATIAAGSVSVLAPVPWLARSYIAILILPLALRFLQWGSPRNGIIAVLGGALFAALTGFVSVLRENHARAFVLDSERKRLQLALDALTPKEQSEPHASARHPEPVLDALTGLLNRNCLHARLTSHIARAIETHNGLVVMHMKLLRFDVIEVQSPLLGDTVLLSIANRIVEQLPATASIARWSDDEFVVALDIAQAQQMDVRSAIAIAEDLRACLRKPVDFEGGLIGVDVTIGVTELGAQESSVEDLLHQASVALFVARQNESGGVLAYSPEMTAQLNDRYLMRQMLHSALRDETLSLVYQPVVPSCRTLPTKMETLLRWNDPKRGSISPASFIPIAEESGLIVPLGAWVLRHACAEASVWPDNTVVCINVSVHQILASDLCAEVRHALHASGLAPERLEIELTESVFARNVEHIRACLAALRALGVKVSIDDFGTGYSSLAYLRHLPVDTVKIDRSFIIDAEPAGRKLLNGIVSIARSLGFRVVGEGVETHQQHEQLLALGIDYMQGYLLSRPLPADRARAWLLEDNTSRYARAPIQSHRHVKVDVTNS